MKNFSAKIVFTAAAALLLTTSCTGESPEQQVKSAKDYLQKNETRAATIQIKNALQKNPDFAEARFLLGNILLKEGNIGDAEIEFRKALAAKHPDQLVIPELARTMLMLGQAKKLVDEFGKSTFEQPAANASLQTTLASAYVALGKPDLAQAALNAALSAEPDYAPAALATARRKAAARDFDSALRTTEEVIAKDPRNADAWKLKGDILLYAQDKIDAALAAYRKSTEVDPKFGPGHTATLTLLMQQGRLEEATKQLEKLKTIAANRPQTMYFEAQLAYQKKDYKLARAICQQLLRFAPDNPAILQLAGSVELQLNSMVQAEIFLTRATQAAPDLAQARELLIATYLRSGQSAKALVALNDATGKDGLAPRMFALAGEVYLQNGDAKRAEEYFAKALKLDPDNTRKRAALAIAHLAGGQTDTAFEELEGIAGSNKDITADLALISAHLRQKEFDKALSAIDRLEAKQPDQPLAANLRGRVQLATNDRAGARKSFERALTIDPSYLAAATSLAALDMADGKVLDAKRRFESLLARNPKSGPALLELARIADASGAGKEEVAVLLSKAADANPDDVAPRLILIQFFLGINDSKRAIAAAQSAVASLPNSPELLEALGRAQQVSGELNQAIATYTKLVTLNSLSPGPHIRLAEAYMANKNNPAAEQSLRKALEIQPDMLQAQRGLIILDLGQQKYQEAMKVARTIKAQRPNAPIGFLMAGDIAVAQKSWDLAETEYRSGLQLGASTDMASRLYSVLIISGRSVDADKFSLKWLGEHPRDVAFLSQRADLAIARTDFAAAEKNYLAVLKIQPDSAIALNNLAWVTGQLHKADAVGYAEKANELAPNQPAFMDTLAMLLAEKNEYVRAIELLVKALDIQPSNSSLRLHLAKLYIKAGDKTKARIELDSLTKPDATSPVQSEASALLKTL